jgi:aspartate kinase
VEFAGKYKVKLRVLSSLTDPNLPIEHEAQSGTLITFEEDDKMEQAIISGIAFNRDEAKITVMCRRWSSCNAWPRRCRVRACI